MPAKSKRSRDDLRIWLDADFVVEWGGRYEREVLDPTELYLLEETGPAIQVRGYALKHEFVAICKWKTNRTKGLIARNIPDEVREVTRLAFSTNDDFLRVRVLQLLRGVGEPTASAVLTVWDPTQFTVVDFRVREAIQTLRLAPGRAESVEAALTDYVAYVCLCRRLAADCGSSLRQLDRALWLWHRQSAATRRS